MTISMTNSFVAASYLFDNSGKWINVNVNVNRKVRKFVYSVVLLYELKDKQNI